MKLIPAVGLTLRPVEIKTEQNGRVDALQGSFVAAARDVDVVERTYLVGGHPVLLRFASLGLASKLEPAFVGLEVEPGRTPSLTINVWDSASGDSIPPPLPETNGHPPTARFLYETDGFRMAYQPAMACLSAIAVRQETAWFWVPDANRIPPFERAAPMRLVWHWWAAERQLALVHAGAVGSSDGGVLLAGPGGSGKTTTALDCLRSGLSYAGDDYVLVSSDGPRVHRLYASAKLNEEDADGFTYLEEIGGYQSHVGHATRKHAYFLNPEGLARTIDDFHLRAVVFPQITGSGTPRLERVSRSLALTKLAPSTLLQLPGAGSASLALMGSILQKVPTFRLVLGDQRRDSAMPIIDLLDSQLEESK